MQHQVSKRTSRQSDNLSTDSGEALRSSLDHKIDASTSPPAFVKFTAPLLRTAGVFTTRRDAKPIHDIWTPIGSPEAALILDWVRRELLTFGFFLELAFSDFSFANAVTEELGQILEAFRSILDGHAYLTLVDGKPAAAIFNGVQRTILTAAPRIIDVLGGDAIKSLHDILHGSALISRPHSQTEIDALLRWTDEAFVTYAIEQITARPVTTGASNRPSKAERDTGEIVSVVLGRCAVAWSTDHPVFARVHEFNAHTFRADSRHGALAKT